MLNSKRIKELRLKYSLTYEQMANDLNVSGMTTWRIENDPKNLSVETLLKISSYFRVSVTELIDFSDVEVPFVGFEKEGLWEVKTKNPVYYTPDLVEFVHGFEYEEYRDDNGVIWEKKKFLVEFEEYRSPFGAKLYKTIYPVSHNIILRLIENGRIRAENKST